MSKILIHSIAFSPDGVSTAYLYNDIALKLQEAGHKVVVLTTKPNFNIIESEIKKQPLTKKWLGIYSVSNFNGIPVKHVAQKKFKNPILRILGFAFWHIITFFLGLSEKKVDLIISPSPPLSIGVLNIFLGKLKNAKVIYNVQEIYPDLLIQSGLKSKPIISILEKFEKFVYNKSDAVTTIDPVFYDTISSRFTDKSKLHIIPNFVDTTIYKPIKEVGDKLDEILFPKSSALKLMYAGNIGIAQDWSTLIKLAEKTRDLDVEYFIIGEGAMKSFLIEEKNKLKLDKISILPYQKRELMPDIIAYSDLQFIFMTPEMDGNGFPSKVYTILACSKPILISSGKNSPIVNFLKDKKFAEIFSQNNLIDRINSMSDFIKNISKSHLIEMGENGVFEIEKNYSKNVVTEKYLNLINDLVL